MDAVRQLPQIGEQLARVGLHLARAAPRATRPGRAGCGPAGAWSASPRPACCTPSWMSRSMRRRSASCAATMRARDRASSATARSGGRSAARSRSRSRPVRPAWRAAPGRPRRTRRRWAPHSIRPTTSSCVAQLLDESGGPVGVPDVPVGTDSQVPGSSPCRDTRTHAAPRPRRTVPARRGSSSSRSTACSSVAPNDVTAGSGWLARRTPSGRRRTPTGGAAAGRPRRRRRSPPPPAGPAPGCPARAPGQRPAPRRPRR